MTERDHRFEDQTNPIIAFADFLSPEKAKGQDYPSMRLAKYLTVCPARLNQMAVEAREQIFLATAGGDMSSVKKIENLLTATDQTLNHEYAWRACQNYEFTTNDADVLLRQIEPTEPNKPRTNLDTNLASIAVSLIRGFLLRRFENGDNPDWRGSFRTMYRFMTAAVESKDPEICNRYFDLLTGSRHIIPTDSFVWQSTTLGEFCFDPQDDEVMALTFDFNECSGLIATYLNRRNDWRHFLEQQMIVIQEIDEWQRYLVKIESTFISENARRKRGNIISNQPGTLRYIRDVADQAIRFPIRYIAKYKAYQQINQGRLSLPEGDNNFALVSCLPSNDGTLEYPFNLLYKESNVRKKAAALLNPEKFTDVYSRNIQAEATERHLQPYPFCQGGLCGWILIDSEKFAENGMRQPATKIRVIKDLIDKYDLTRVFQVLIEEKRQQELDYAFLRHNLPNGVEIIFFPTGKPANK